MQLSGSFLQSVLHLNLSQLSHPMGGVLARPFSSPVAALANSTLNSVLINIITDLKKVKDKNKSDRKRT